jgi:hypothetical protein
VRDLRVAEDFDAIGVDHDVLCRRQEGDNDRPDGEGAEIAVVGLLAPSCHSAPNSRTWTKNNHARRWPNISSGLAAAPCQPAGPTGILSVYGVVRPMAKRIADLSIPTFDSQIVNCPSSKVQREA